MCDVHIANDVHNSGALACSYCHVYSLDMLSLVYLCNRYFLTYNQKYGSCAFFVKPLKNPN